MDLKCSVCLEEGSNFRRITEPEGDYSILHKLQSCVPEIEWKEDYVICPSCNIELNRVHEFREKCITSDYSRNEILFIKQEPPPVTLTDELPPVTEELYPSVTLKEEQPSEIQQKPFQFNCEICGEGFKYRTRLVSHSVKKHNLEAKDVKPFICHVCSHRFRRSSNLNQHLKYHDGSRSHVCTYCGKSYITSSDLKIHEKIHLNKREHKCEECNKCFNTHKDVRSHKLIVHTDPSLWNYECEICLKKFPIKSNFDAHMRRHNNERPFGCHLCEKKFIEKCTLKKHLLSHTNNRAYACNICKKEYKAKRIMELHKMKVHGIGDIKVPERIRKHLCHLCPRAFFDKNKLTRHMYSHTGERPFICEFCSKAFVDKSYLKQHMKKSHNLKADETDVN